ncbi:caspase family protein [Methylorubrum populi]|uniref:caspase family protein n=1 Tax=Methylorubrum populi TaxID=223967 RepID=UPI001150FCF1|nr:caspase family protein [Methylorubrum populi]QDI82354.1 caspase family protein [Methylorubrum populi]
MTKRALMVGINAYRNPNFNLKECLNDVDSLKSLLTSGPYNFSIDDIESLTDTSATKQNIMSRLEQMLASANEGDTLVFAYSGHGTQTTSQDPSEVDMKDECLVPHEGTFTALIKDNELSELYNKYINEKIKFTAIYDMCHSGTMIRELAMVGDEIVENITNRCLDIFDLKEKKFRDKELGPYNVLSACKDDETAADVREVGPRRLPRGAFSYSLHNFLSSTPDVPVSLADRQILDGIKNISNHNQNPHYVLYDINSPLIRY